MFPQLLRVGRITINTYGFMIAIGIAAAVLLALYRSRARGLSKDIVIDIAIYGVVGGLIGAKALFLIVELPYILKDPVIIKDLLAAGFVFYGAVIGGALAAYIYCRRQKVSFLEYFDLIVPSIALAQAFGRIGCFFAGCCYGKETTSSIGVIFHNSPIAPSGVKLIPTQIISSLGDFLIAAILIAFALKPRSNGRVSGLYMILYSVGRFIIEFFRGDPRGSVGPLSTSQFICIFIFIGGLILYNLDRIKSYKTQEIT